MTRRFRFPPVGVLPACALLVASLALTPAEPVRAADGARRDPQRYQGFPAVPQDGDHRRHRRDHPGRGSERQRDPERYQGFRSRPQHDERGARRDRHSHERSRRSRHEGAGAAGHGYGVTRERPRGARGSGHRGGHHGHPGHGSRGGRGRPGG